MKQATDDARGVAVGRRFFAMLRRRPPRPRRRRHDRHATGEDTAGANLPAQRRRAGHHNPDHRRTSQDPDLKKMNEDEKQKVDTKGK